MPYRKARLVHYLKEIDPSGGIEERKIWEVPVSERNPDGVRYRLAYIPQGQRKPAVLYDNHHPKGHHKHVDGEEAAYEYSGIAQLLADFRKDVEAPR